MKPYGLTLGEKTVDCLRLCALPIIEREAMREQLDAKWGLKAVYKTIENHGSLFDWGTSCRCAWLTEEGNSALADIDPSHEPMRGKYGLRQVHEKMRCSVVRDETGAELGEMRSIEAGLLDVIRVPYLISEGLDPVYGELRLEARRWRTADGKLESFLFVHRADALHLEKVRGFVRNEAYAWTKEPPA